MKWHAHLREHALKVLVQTGRLLALVLSVLGFLLLLFLLWSFGLCPLGLGVVRLATTVCHWCFLKWEFPILGNPRPRSSVRQLLLDGIRAQKEQILEAIRTAACRTAGREA